MYKITILAICLLVSVHQTQSDVVQTIKDGLKTAYSGVHCGLHKVKELVHHHEHEVDPCNPKEKTDIEITTVKIEDFELLPKPTLKPENKNEKPVNYEARSEGGAGQGNYENEYSAGNSGQRNYDGRPPYSNNNNNNNNGLNNFESGPSATAKQENYGWREDYVKQ